MLLHGPNTVEWLEPPAGPALGLNGTDWPLNELELPEGHGLRAAHRRHVRGALRCGQRAARRGRACSSWPGRWPLCPARSSSTRSIDGAEERAEAHGGLTDDIAVVRVERTADDAEPEPSESQLTVQGWQNLVLVVMGSWCSPGRSPGGRC